ncbi:MAG: type I DNA topoisomerase, partial [Alphaproteobacteria bacterium]|nr:type I DNA topoisomerase [Alphaproteobacteria bacterium]
MDVVVVESPAKAKTINKYLGSDYVVLASYGHVRDLPSKDGSVRPDDDFAMTYECDAKSAKHVKAIADAMRQADHLYLATDPDREGEAISWHVIRALEERYGLKDINAKRVVFNEITKRAVLEGINNPRELDLDLINAQQARRALDYLVGFTLSPVLWRKLPGARSAGRVQSVALRLICEREIEIETFVSREYWSIEVDFRTPGGDPLIARLTHLDGEKLDRFSLADQAAAEAAVRTIEAGDFTVAKVETKPTRRNPQPPFTTSTLQQEASRKLGFGAGRTMQVAQRLYEGIDIGGETVGLITYMRTDGVQMANEAIAQGRSVIEREFGAAYLPEAPRVYRTKAKNAQEAHEAIRPTDFSRLPAEMRRYLDNEQGRLYELIWQRAMASQMAQARLSRTTIDIAADNQRSMLRATGSVIEFPGFLKLYEESLDDTAEKAKDDGER